MAKIVKAGSTTGDGRYRYEIKLTPLLRKDRKIKLYSLLFVAFVVFYLLAVTYPPIKTMSGASSLNIQFSEGADSTSSFPTSLSLSPYSYFNLTYDLGNSSYMDYQITSQNFSAFGSGKVANAEGGNLTGQGTYSFHNGNSPSNVVYHITVGTLNHTAEEVLTFTATAYYPITINPYYLMGGLFLLCAGCVGVGMRITSVHKEAAKKVDSARRTGEEAKDGDVRIQLVKVPIGVRKGYMLAMFLAGVGCLLLGGVLHGSSSGLEFLNILLLIVGALLLVTSMLMLFVKMV